MQVVERASELSQILRRYRTSASTVGFVPTMGALHEGHLSLARRAAQENVTSLMSIYVNPKQFGPKEDFSAYPRTIERDTALAKESGIDYLFLPRDEEVYPEGYSTTVDVTSLSRPLCGMFRPGHFQGVATVVLRLFQWVKPDRAYFGQKDAQQLRVIQKMTEDLLLGIEIVPCPTVREKDGLAMSSRNAYLSSEERVSAPILYRALDAAHRAFSAGERDAAQLELVGRRPLEDSGKFEIQYLEIRRMKDLERVATVTEPSLLAAAVILGKTRLIDNVVFAP